MNSMDQSKMQQFYEDIREFKDEVSQSYNEWQIVLMPGTLLLVDNWRVLLAHESAEDVHDDDEQREVVSCSVARTEFMAVSRQMGLID